MEDKTSILGVLVERALNQQEYGTYWDDNLLYLGIDTGGLRGGPREAGSLAALGDLARMAQLLAKHDGDYSKALKELQKEHEGEFEDGEKFRVSKLFDSLWSSSVGNHALPHIDDAVSATTIYPKIVASKKFFNLTRLFKYAAAELVKRGTGIDIGATPIMNMDLLARTHRGEEDPKLGLDLGALKQDDMTEMNFVVLNRKTMLCEVVNPLADKCKNLINLMIDGSRIAFIGGKAESDYMEPMISPLQAIEDDIKAKQEVNKKKALVLFASSHKLVEGAYTEEISFGKRMMDKITHKLTCLGLDREQGKKYLDYINKNETENAVLAERLRKDPRYLFIGVPKDAGDIEYTCTNPLKHIDQSISAHKNIINMGFPEIEAALKARGITLKNVPGNNAQLLPPPRSWVEIKEGLSHKNGPKRNLRSRIKTTLGFGAA